MNKKNIVIISVAVVVFAIIIGGFLFWKNSQKIEISQQQNQNQQSNEDTRDESAGIRDVAMDTSDWVIEKNDVIDFSFHYPRDAKNINEGNCYRVEYGLGFAIFFLPIEGDMRCGARTGVGVLPDNVDVTDYLTIGGKKYEAQGFRAVIDTKGEKFFKPDTRYFYDFYYMFDLNKDKNCGDASGCERVGYGIYKEVSTPLSEEDIDNTMNTLRAIIESVNFNMP
ncbi:MAG: hypothetical protein M0P97_04370 [Candidatus Moranbacteria bacterium]|jgi:hypothetical protein|nr:hypothetical protein [Candidatus Moranbacteria bacterium]